MTEITPQQVRTATFKTTRKGFDPDEVAAFLRSAAEALEVAQNQAAAMEARARAAVARLQELTAGREQAAPAPPPPEEVHAPIEEAQVISRTLLLAQRTADQAVADATAEAERILAAARTEAEHTIDSTREMSARLVDEARAEARTASDEERRRATEEVQSLLARREFLLGDVDHLEHFLVDQRERIREAAAAITEICDRVPAGLAGVRKPLLSASADDDLRDPDATMAIEAVASPADDAASTTGGADDAGGADGAPADDEDAPGEPDGGAAAPADAESDADADADAAAPDELVIRTDLAEQVADDATPSTGEPQLRFDADDLRRLGESRNIG